jgi:hypothetical protein
MEIDLNVIKSSVILYISANPFFTQTLRKRKKQSNNFLGHKGNIMMIFE